MTTLAMIKGEKAPRRDTEGEATRETVKCKHLAEERATVAEVDAVHGHTAQGIPEKMFV